MNISNKNRRWHVRRIGLLLMDILTIQLASFLALIIRFDFIVSAVEPIFMKSVIYYAPLNTVVTLVCFYAFRLYNSLWDYAGLDETIYIIEACLTSGLVQFVSYMVLGLKVPRSYYFISVLFLIWFVCLSRFSYRAIRRWIQSVEERGNQANLKKVMIIGAGDAGYMLMKDLTSNEKSKSKVCCIIDDDDTKWGKYIFDACIIGGRDQINEGVKKYEIEQIIIALPKYSNSEIKKLIAICSKTDCEVKRLPALYQLADGDITISKLRDVEIEDLLGRDPIQLDLDTILPDLKRKVVMITGGGGSIGSELCRQIAAYEPSTLLVVDIYENNVYDVQQMLRKTYPDLNLQVRIASVRDRERLEKLFEEFHPEIIYHAAAHKHVPLMEDSPNEAIKNNVFGTLNMVQLADQYKVKRFVMISTDKAVNPTNIMGATKRICEMIIQTYNGRSKTEFVAVRFGNVLGSNGSVIPLFKRQIKEGGPVTVTHPDIIRYFMTIPEAVSLVIQAGGYAKGGEIFVLDMGEPVKILDLAKNLIRLSGYKPDEDIKIVFTGLRPGEKLYEELLMDEEGLKETPNHLIHIGRPIDFNETKFEEDLKRLKDAADHNSDRIKELVCGVVPTYVITNN